jgi:hypothetical protein
MNRTELEDDREIFEGIASILLSLAVLSEFLCLLPLWVRLPVLMLLRSAEAVTRAFALECAGGRLALPPAASPGPDRDGRIEAMRLARCFRVLAAVFSGSQALAAWRLFGGGRGGRFAHSTPAPAWAGHALMTRRAAAFGAAGRIDTS